MTTLTDSEILLNQNDDELDLLKRKTEAIKRASTSLKNKIEDSNTQLDQTSIDMGELNDFANKSVDIVSKLVGRKVTYKHCFYLIFVLVIILMILYILMFKIDWSKPEDVGIDEKKTN